MLPAQRRLSGLPTANGDPAHDNASDEADDQTEHEHEKFQRSQCQCRLDRQPVYGDLLACRMERPRIDENDQDGEQSCEDTCHDSGDERRGETLPGQ